MKINDRVEKYIKDVLNMVKWKEAHKVISKELQGHIEDQMDSYISKGVEENLACEMAIKEMGDPVMIGEKLNKSYRPKLEISIVVLIGVLLCINFIVQANMKGLSMEYFVTLFLGIIALIIGYFINFSFLMKHLKIIFIIFASAVMVLLILFPYTTLMYFYIRPLFLLIPITLAGFIYHIRNKLIWRILLPILIAYSPLIINFLDISKIEIPSSFLICTSCAILFSIAILPKLSRIKKIASLFIINIPSILLITLPIVQRIQIYYNSIIVEEAPFIPAIREILSSAKLFGQSTTSTISNVSSFYEDFLLTLLIHKFGWISFIAIILFLFILISRMFFIIKNQSTTISRLLGIAVLLTISFEVFYFILNNLGVLVTSFSLPLVSADIRFLTTNLFLLGILLSIFKTNKLYND